MGIFKSLFGGNKKEPEITIDVELEPVKKTNVKGATTQGNGTKDEADISKKESKRIYEPQDLVMLYLAEKYRVDEKNFPQYLYFKYGIGFPKGNLKKLSKNGLIRSSTPKETLPKLKVAELKEIAAKYGIKVSGKKEVICATLAENLSESDLDKFVKDRYWVITDEGHAVLKQNPHIEFYMADHPYNFIAMDLDINAFCKLYEKKKGGTVRDTLWGEFNRRIIPAYKKGVTKGEFYEYTSLLRNMALFLEEENRHKDALAQYMKYLNYKANFDAGLSALRNYQYIKKLDDATDMLFTNVEILPFMREELSLMCDGCGFDEDEAKTFMLDSLAKEKDTGLFSPEELTELVISGMRGDIGAQKQICKIAMRNAVKKLPKK